MQACPASVYPGRLVASALASPAVARSFSGCRCNRCPRLAQDRRELGVCRSSEEDHGAVE